MANLWNILNACGWQGRTGEENEKTRIYQGCQRDVLVTVRCCFRLVVVKKVPPGNPKVGRRLFGGPTPLQSDTWQMKMSDEGIRYDDGWGQHTYEKVLAHAYQELDRKYITS